MRHAPGGATVMGEEVAAMTEPRTPVSELGLREQATIRLRKTSEFRAHLLAYVLCNAFLLTIWALTGTGFFWPAFPLLGWGIGVVFHAWDTYRRPFSEEQIQREMQRMR
jgi:2TM domain